MPSARAARARGARVTNESLHRRARRAGLSPHEYDEEGSSDDLQQSPSVHARPPDESLGSPLRESRACQIADTTVTPDVLAPRHNSTALTPVVRRSLRISSRELSFFDQLRMETSTLPRRKTRSHVRSERAQKQAARDAREREHCVSGVGDGDKACPDGSNGSANDNEHEEEGAEEMRAEEMVNEGSDREDKSGAVHSRDVDGEASNASGDEAFQHDEVSEEDKHGAALAAATHRQYVPSKADTCVTPPETYHEDWNAWERYLEVYAPSSYQLIVILHTMSWGMKDKRVRATKAFQQSGRGQIPVEWNPFSRVYICTHGWRDKKSKGTGKWPRQHVRSLDCPFKFTVQARPKIRGQFDGEWHLVVSHGFFVHNHAVTKAAYLTYPKARGIVDPIVAAKVDGMLTTGTKRSKIYDYLLSADQNVYQRDIDNKVSNHETSVAGEDDDEATAAEVAKFARACPENIVTISETARGETGVLTFNTKMMREVYARFSELLLVDCTHKTNRYNYQLMTFMVMTELGEGMPVQQSLVEANGNWHMDRACAHFKRANPDKWRLLRVIMVDKDLQEIRVLRTHFPEARILLCYFHVRKYLKERSGKPEYGQITADDKKSIDMVMSRVITADDDEIYERNRALLKAMCERMGCEGFYEYWLKNWDSCQDMWVLGRRSHLPHFKTATNNMLESWFGKYKDGIKSEQTLTETVRSLCAAAARLENEHTFHTDRLGRIVNIGYDEEMSNVLRFTTHFVAGKIAIQYSAGIANAEVYKFNVDEGNHTVTVQGPRRVHVVNTMDWSCNCDFVAAMRLPCRHVIAYRKHAKVPGTVISLKRIDPRWTSLYVSLQHTKQFDYEAFDEVAEDTVEPAVKRQRKALTRTERYSEGVRAFHMIANELADVEDDEAYHEMVAFLHQQWRNVRQQRRIGSDQPASAQLQGAAISSRSDVHDRAVLRGKSETVIEPGLVHDRAVVRGVDATVTEPGLVHDRAVVRGVDATVTEPGLVRDQAVAYGDGEDEDVELERTKPSTEPLELSQAHSLWSEEMGDVPVVDTGLVHFGQPHELSQLNADAALAVPTQDIADVKIELAKEASVPTHAVTNVKIERAKGDSDFESDTEDMRLRIAANPKAHFKIKVSKDAKKTGRKRKNVKQIAVEEASDYKRFNAAEDTRRQLGVITLDEFADSLDKKRPSLHDAHVLLRGICERKTAHGGNRPQYRRMRNPLLNKDVFYLLPQGLLDACVKSFPLSNTYATAISVDGSQDSQPSTPRRSSPRTKDVEVVTIKDVGTFSRKQIEEMQRVAKMKEQVALGIEACMWLRECVAPAVPAHQQSTVADDAAKILASYPSTRLPGLLSEEYVYGILYRALPPTYFNDAFITATCTRIGQLHPRARFVHGLAGNKGRRKVPADRSITGQVKALMNGGDVDWVFLPINFGNAHWCGILVDVKGKCILTYDPLNDGHFRSSIVLQAQGFVLSGLAGFTVRERDSPVQQDFHSCGLFVAWFFYHTVAPQASYNMSQGQQLTRRRFEIFHFVMTGEPPEETIPEPPKSIFISPSLTKTASTPTLDSVTKPAPSPAKSAADLHPRPTTVPSTAASRGISVEAATLLMPDLISEFNRVASRRTDDAVDVPRESDETSPDVSI